MIVIDDLNREIILDDVPRRIISLVPSLTELLFDLGLEDRIVGVTKFCIHPKQAKKICRSIGGTKKFDFSQIEELRPDLIIANKEENYKEGIERLCNDYKVYTSDIFDLDDAIRTITNIGLLTNTESKAKYYSSLIQQRFDDVKNKKEGNVIYFIWQEPNMIAASNTFIDFVLRWVGYNNVASDLKRYPELMENHLISLNPDFVFLSSEPFPFKEKHIAYFNALFPNAEILLVDGEMFSWYGSRLQYAPDYFMGLPMKKQKE